LDVPSPPRSSRPLRRLARQSPTRLAPLRLCLTPRPPASALSPYTTLFRSIYARHILRTRPDAKIGVLYQNDDFGRDYLAEVVVLDRKSTRLNSSHVKISYAVFCLKKKIPSRHT